ncbi:histidine kinase [Citricoccus sp. I39-566]|uniref:sensor histidine kinase n=1 Tax=Citricoccus sp. I39-566 TaxID=3073268 RepID=UPI00286C40BA|nr:histidine kinase [Citricoccus sp. I39-566]WMY77201.1 histidine kinase [Citricoccus sp. I39-566]
MRATQSGPLAQTPVSFSSTGWLYLLTGFGAVAQLSIGWPVLAAVHEAHVLAAMVASMLLAAALPVAVHRPRLGILLGAVGALLSSLTVDPLSGPWPWPVTSLIWYVFLVLLLAATAGWRMGAAAWLAGTMVSVLGITLVAPDHGDGAFGNVIVVASLTAAALSIGSAVRQLTSSRRQLVQERQLTAEEETKRRELQQRNRIAQELHDVVAHSLSVISVQATTAPYRLPGMDEPTRGEFDSIAGSSRRALTEMRGLLAVLRGDDAAETAPQPTIADIPALVANARASGARVDLEIDPELLPQGGVAGPVDAEATTGDPTTVIGGPSAAGDWSAVVPPATGLTAYRTVQEAVSNALRHAPGAAIRVQVSMGDLIGVRVVNGPATRTLAVPAPGAGLGLKGLTERVSALGGTVTAGPTPDGGFTVKARLPL